MSGEAVASHWQSDPKIPKGVQLPTPEVENEIVLEGEGQSDWIMGVEDFAEEYAMAADISDAEALEPCSLTEAK